MISWFVSKKNFFFQSIHSYLAIRFQRICINEKLLPFPKTHTCVSMCVSVSAFCLHTSVSLLYLSLHYFACFLFCHPSLSETLTLFTLISPSLSLSLSLALSHHTHTKASPKDIIISPLFQPLCKQLLFTLSHTYGSLFNHSKLVLFFSTCYTCPFVLLLSFWWEKSL